VLKIASDEVDFTLTCCRLVRLKALEGTGMSYMKEELTPGYRKASQIRGMSFKLLSIPELLIDDA
jgi:hypothetical protein